MLKTDPYVAHIQKHAILFSDTADLEALIKAASNAKYVLLGESSHGTSEFYSIRSEITKKLIEHHGFSFVAVEGDWPACYEINQFIKGKAPEYQDAKSALQSFNRWPSWMWANHEIISLIEWLKSFNQKRQDIKAGFYGLDVYSLWESMEAIIGYLEKIDSPDLEKAKTAFDCFEPFQRKPESYGISSAFYGEDCLDEVKDLLQTLQQNKKMYDGDPDSSLNIQINALVASNAESYYHAMVTNDQESWNIRDRHMVEALDLIGNYYGVEGKGIIWEHNTHIGDARATDMANDGLVNVGQLSREKYGKENIYSVGFGTHHGTVIASTKWGESFKKMNVPKAVNGSWENVVHQAGAFNKYMLFTDENRELFNNTIGHRAIGVVYRPDIEHLGNYVPSRISERYDAFIHVEETSALVPLTY
jgi:erythromycin esterase-like protein